MSRIRVLLVLVLTGIPASQQMLCDQDFCDCRSATHPSWIFVNCTVPNDQKLKILEGEVPDDATDINVTGGQSIEFGPNSLSRLKDGRFVQVSGSRSIILKKHAGLELNTVSLFLDVKDCDSLIIEERAFSNIKGPLSVTVERCDLVSIEGEAFSWLLAVTVRHVRELLLKSGAFVLDAAAANIGLHGPGLVVELTNLTVPKFTSQTFGSSAAAITLNDVVVHHIQPDAFTANTYISFEANNCRFDHLHRDAFSRKTLIHYFTLHGCNVGIFGTGALHSAIQIMNISDTKFDIIKTGAINTTAANLHVENSKFVHVEERGFVLFSCYQMFMRKNTFDFLAPNAIVTEGIKRMNSLVFKDNNIETLSQNSLGFIGVAYSTIPNQVTYALNYYAKACNCYISEWLADVLGATVGLPFHEESYCLIQEFFATCFNEEEQNMSVSKFIHKVCMDESDIKCQSFDLETKMRNAEMKNPRFPHIVQYEVVDDRNKKVIGIFVVTVLGCVIICMLISLIRCMNRKGYCMIIKNFLISSQSSCGRLCNRIFSCGNNRGVDNAAGSINNISIHEFSERHRLNEPRIDTIQETALSNGYNEVDIQMEDKITQTLPEELTQELLENLKHRLDDPCSYKEARDTIEHLYELIKVEENYPPKTLMRKGLEENIYELPIVRTLPRIGRNMKDVISVGTNTPLKPYMRTTALVEDYFEPMDLAAHIYAEISNYAPKHLETGQKQFSPNKATSDVVPRGPFLDAMRHRDKQPKPTCTRPSSKSPKFSTPEVSTIKSNKSNVSNGSARLMNRPLPEKPNVDPGEGTSAPR